jgi:hypothetical protein
LNIAQKYFYNILISIDQFGNTVLGGDQDETISSRLGRLEKKYNGNIPWYRPWAKVTAWALDHIQKDHCTHAIEEDEGKDGIVDKP